LRYKVKNERDLIRFRDSWANLFEKISKNDKELAKFYQEVRSKEKVRFRANLRSRWDLFYESKIRIGL
jgi:hypothetical protein